MNYNSESKIVISGLFWKFSERIAAQFVSFIVSVILARLLIPSEYGVVSLILVFITIANVFVTSGLSSALIQKKEASEIDFSTIFYCNVGISFLLYVFLFLISPYIAKFYKIPSLTMYIRVFSVKILIASYNSVQHAYVSRHMIFKKFFFSTIIGTVISGIFGIVLAYRGFGAWALICQYLINSLIDSIVLGFTIPWRPKLIFSLHSARSLFGFGWKVLATDLLGTIFDNLRSILIGKYYKSSDLAFYNKGKQIPSLIGDNIDSSLTSVLFPAMSNVSTDKERIKEMTRRSMKLSSYLMFPLMAGLIAISKPLITVLLTEKWIDSVFYLQIHCISQAVSTVSKANLQAIKALGRSDITLVMELIKKPIYLIMLIISMKYNIRVIALSLMIYNLMATLINMHPNKMLMNYSFKEQLTDLLPQIGFSFIMWLIIAQFNKLSFPLFIIIIIQLVCGFFIYIALSYIFKNDSFLYIIRYLKKIYEEKYVK